MDTAAKLPPFAPNARWLRRGRGLVLFVRSVPRPNCLLLALVGSVACGSSAGTGSGHGVGAGTPGFGDAGAGVGPSGAGASGTPCLDLDADAFQVSFGKDYLLAANTEGLTLL